MNWTPPRQMTFFRRVGAEYPLFKTTRDEEEGETGWTDYGDGYWASKEGGHDVGASGLSEQSRLWVGASKAARMSCEREHHLHEREEGEENARSWSRQPHGYA